MIKPREPQTESTEQTGEDQAQDVARDRLEGVPGDDHDIFASTKPKGGLADDNDLIDIVDHMKAMVTSGRVDMSAYAGEPMMDDGDTVISDAVTADGAEGDDDIGANPDDTGILADIADTGSDPLADIASEHGNADETAADDADQNDIDDEGDDDGPQETDRDS